MRKILFTMLLFATISSYAQDQAYKFVKGSGSFKLLGSDTIRFETYVKKSDGTKQRSVSASSAKYLFVLKKTKLGKVQEIIGDDGKVLATVLMAGNGKFDIVLESGERYKWKKIDGRNWAYEYKGSVVLKGAYQKENSIKKIVNTTVSEEVPEFLQLSSFERGGEIIAAKASTGPMILVAVITTVVTQASLQ